MLVRTYISDRQTLFVCEFFSWLRLVGFASHQCIPSHVFTVETFSGFSSSLPLSWEFAQFNFIATQTDLYIYTYLYTYLTPFIKRKQLAMKAATATTSNEIEKKKKITNFADVRWEIKLRFGFTSVGNPFSVCLLCVTKNASFIFIFVRIITVFACTWFSVVSFSSIWWLNQFLVKMITFSMLIAPIWRYIHE